MITKRLAFILFCLFTALHSFSQTEKDSTSIAIEEAPIITKKPLTKKAIDPLQPSKAAFYSAILPGLGQAYNKKYWKIPIAWGLVGGGIYFYIRNDKQYNRYRDAYKRRLAGFRDDEFYDANGNALISDDGLIRAQQQFRRNKELSLLWTIGFYVLNIIDANVDAHLLQFNVDENLSLRPHYKFDGLDNTSDLGVTVNFKF